jgi:hypothetical protein
MSRALVGFVLLIVLLLPTTGCVLPELPSSKKECPGTAPDQELPEISVHILIIEEHEILQTINMSVLGNETIWHLSRHSLEWYNTQDENGYQYGRCDGNLSSFFGFKNNMTHSWKLMVWHGSEDTLVEKVAGVNQPTVSDYPTFSWAFQDRSISTLNLSIPK